GGPRRRGHERGAHAGKRGPGYAGVHCPRTGDGNRFGRARRHLCDRLSGLLAPDRAIRVQRRDPHGAARAACASATCASISSDGPADSAGLRCPRAIRSGKGPRAATAVRARAVAAAGRGGGRERLDPGPSTGMVDVPPARHRRNLISPVRCLCHRPAYWVAEPRVPLVLRQGSGRRRTVLRFQGRHDVGHGTLRRDPSAVDVREIELAVVALLRSEEHTSELQSRFDLVCRLLLEKKKYTIREFRVFRGSRFSFHLHAINIRSHSATPMILVALPSPLPPAYPATSVSSISPLSRVL